MYNMLAAVDANAQSLVDVASTTFGVVTPVVISIVGFGIILALAKLLKRK